MNEPVATASSVKFSTIASNVVAIVYALPFAAVVLIWLTAVTPFSQLPSNGGILILLILLALVMRQFDFSLGSSLKTAPYATDRLSLAPLVYWSGILLFGEWGIWVVVLTAVLHFMYQLVTNQTSIWIAFPALLFDFSREAGAGLLALSVYRLLGGAIPFLGVTTVDPVALFLATLVWILWPLVLPIPLNVFLNRNQSEHSPNGSWRKQLFRSWWQELAFVALVSLFAIFAAELYGQTIRFYLTLNIGIGVVSLIFNQVDARLARQEAALQTAISPDALATILEEQANVYKQELYSQAYETEIYSQALAYEKVSQDLQVAGEIQNSFLPLHIPDLDGWQLSVTLKSAMETSGDYYDFFELPNGRFGLLVADVADKGIGPALYMAMSRTLIRTFALTKGTSPEKTLAEVNRRILLDTNSDLFVTVFYGELELETGQFYYCNAGHNPPYLVPAENGKPVRKLTRTALPVGLFLEEEVGQPWNCAQVQIEPGDVLVLYTDGIVEAQDEEQLLFGEDNFEKVLLANRRRPAEIIEEKVMDSIENFVGDAVQTDDITLMILIRE